MTYIDEMKNKLANPAENFTRADMQKVIQEYMILETRYNRLKESLISCGINAQQTAERIIKKLSETEPQ